MGLLDDFWNPNKTNHAPAYNAQQANLSETDYARAIMNAQGSAQRAEQGAGHVGYQQGMLAQDLQAQAAGQGPSLAQMQLMQATNQNNAMSAGMAASQRGINPALAQRMAMQNQATMNQGAAAQSGQLRLQEQMQARQQLGDVLNAQRQGYLGQQQNNAGMFGQAGQLQNQQNQGRITNLNNAQQLNQNSAMQAQALNAGGANRNTEHQRGILGGLIGGAGSLLAGPLGLGMAEGGLIPGDHPRNDTVPAMLSPKEIVLPRSVTMSAEAPEKAAAFVAAIKATDGKKSAGGYGEVLQKQRELQARLDQLEAMMGGNG